MGRTFKTLVIVGLTIMLILVAVLFYIVVGDQITTKRTGEVVVTATSPPALSSGFSGQIWGQDGEMVLAVLNDEMDYSFKWDPAKNWWIDLSNSDDFGIALSISPDQSGDVAAITVIMDLRYDDKMQGVIAGLFYTNCNLPVVEITNWLADNNDQIVRDSRDGYPTADEVAGIIVVASVELNFLTIALAGQPY